MVLMLVAVTAPMHSAEKFAARDLVFLTRDGCVNTAKMRVNLIEALTFLGLPADYVLIDADKLEPSDRRRGYGTPTVLYKNRDVFGMAAPTANPHSPS